MRARGGGRRGFTVTLGTRRPAAREVPVSGPPLVLASQGRPIPALESGYPDLAVLRVAGLDGHPCVSVDPQWPGPHDQFQVFGYPREGGAERLTPARLTYRGTHGTAPTAFLDLASDTIKPGMSGAAVLNLRTGGICGVVVASKHPSSPGRRPGHPLGGGRGGARRGAGRQPGLPGERPALGHRSGPAGNPGGTGDQRRLRVKVRRGSPVRVFISYAHDDQTHEDRVRQLWMFLRGQGIDAPPGPAGR